MKEGKRKGKKGKKKNKGKENELATGAMVGEMTELFKNTYCSCKDPSSVSSPHAMNSSQPVTAAPGGLTFSSCIWEPSLAPE